jgi:hypothetical protein
MKVSRSELAFVRRHLDALKDHPDEAGRVEMARRYVEEWERL